jgi:cyanophycinase
MRIQSRSRPSCTGNKRKNAGQYRKASAAYDTFGLNTHSSGSNAQRSATTRSATTRSATPRRWLDCGSRSPYSRRRFDIVAEVNSGVTLRPQIMKTTLLLIATLSLGITGTLAHAGSYQYFRLGNRDDTQTKPTPGVAMMGGGTDLDEAFRWLCRKANGGDFLILRATGDDDYNSYVNGLCKVNSVATLIIPNREAAQDPAVAEIIRKAEVVFIAGGDQSNYVRGWKGTPVEAAINDDVAAGKPIGGTSAGLAVLGQFVYGCLGDKPDDKDLASDDVLPNPYFDRVTLVRDFLRIPHMENLLTDSHFAKRDRMGRTLVFLARIMQDEWSQTPREVSIDEKSAVLVEADGTGTVVGSGKGAYFLRPTELPQVCRRGVPLTFRGVSVYKVPSGGDFNLASWAGHGGTTYSLTVEHGVIQSTQANHSIY